MTNLKEARQKGKIKDFIKEREADPEGDLDKLDETMDRVTRAAIDAIMECESAAMLDLSVGPEDGIN